MAALYRAEAERWASRLEWDTAQAWPELERGRTLGTVSGIVVTDEADRIAGWCYYLVHKGTLQVGGFVAESEAAAQLMLDRILRNDTQAGVDAVTFFAFSDAPALPALLRACGMAVDRYWYLARDLARRPPVSIADVRSWRSDDLKPTAELLRRSYAPADPSRPFAPGGTQDEWIEYVAQLVAGPGCGALLPEACFVVPGGPDRLLGAAVVTSIAPTTAHLAQLAVDAHLRGRGVGTRLVEFAASAAALAGYRRLTLLVSARNGAARSLYETLRFETVASMLAAGMSQPRRSTSVAPSGVAMTRR
jgi:ribosomal protein S18 acetylase RimI-like enzyme